jgi:adenosine deaminase
MKNQYQKVEEYMAPTTLLNPKVMREFPKIELHRHLEGTFSLNTLYSIASKNSIEIPKDFEEFKKAVQFPKKGKPDFLLFLSKFRNDWYRSYEDVYAITHDSVLEFADDGIFHMELRFSPEHFSLQNDFDRVEITDLVIKAATDAAKKIGISQTYLLTFNRSKQDQHEMIDLYKKLMKLNLDSIVGIDLAGDELNFPPELFVEFFKAVKADGRSCTIHAGEVTPSNQIWTAIKQLGAKRIGHGTSTVHDPELQKFLIDQQIVLEQCITSNYQTGSWEDEKNHPLGRLFKAGVPVTINSDDPFIQDTLLSDDYVKTVEYFDFTLEDLIKANKIALDGCFLTQTQKNDLWKNYIAKVESFKIQHGLV